MTTFNLLVSFNSFLVKEGIKKIMVEEFERPSIKGRAGEYGVKILRGLTPEKEFKVLLHEGAHYLLGHPWEKLPKGQKEWEAELVVEGILLGVGLPSQGDKYRLQYEPGNPRLEKVQEVVNKVLLYHKAYKPLLSPPKRK